MTTLLGLFRLGRDAELRTTANGDSVASMALAYNYGRRDDSGKQPTQWLDAALWGERASKLAEYLTGVKLTGRIGMLEFAGDRAASAPRAAPAPAPRAPAAPRPAPGAGSGFDDMDDDIPW